jgi:AAA domain
LPASILSSLVLVRESASISFYQASASKGTWPGMKNGSREFIDEGKESAVVGTVITGHLDRVPESKLISPKAFTDRRCQIVYSGMFSLRKAGIPICVERVSDLIERQGLGNEFQRLLDKSKTLYWRDTWQDFFDHSLTSNPGTAQLEYFLECLGEMYEAREMAVLAKRMEAGELSHKEVIEALRKLASETRSLPPDGIGQGALLEAPTPPEIIKGILHQGSKMAFGGGSKSFKTWTLLELSVCIATGRDWLGFPTTKGRVLSVNFELPRFAIGKRVREICEAMGVEVPENLVLWNRRGYATNAETILPDDHARGQGGMFHIYCPRPSL